MTGEPRERATHPCSDEVEEQLQRILDDRAFAASARDRKFLRYVVTETLAGRGDRIKAYSIATVVFGRGPGFDAQIDPVVRIEAGRLRRALERYYLLAGHDDSVVIDIPKGSYKPTFDWRSAPASPRRAKLDGRPDARREHQLSAPKSSISIVVLPFANLNADPEQDYFAEAVVADLTTDLSRIAGSFVIDRNTALTYKGRSIQAKDIGRELEVSFILEGSVRRERESVRVNVELVETRTGGQVWAHRFEGDSSNLFALQDLMTSNIAATLNAELVTAAARQVNPHVDPNALDLVLRARAASSRPRTKQNLAEAQQLYEQALGLQPDNAEAKIGLAEVLVGMALSLLSMTRESDLRSADELVSVALASQPNSAWAHYVKGEILRCTRRTGEAIVHYEAAVSLNPNYAAAIANLGYSWMLVGKPAEGVVLLERAIRMSPRDPLLAIWYSRVGQGDLYLERFESAKTALEKSRALNPALPWNHFYLAGTYALLGNVDEGKAALSAAQKVAPGLSSIEDYKSLSQASHPELELMRERTLVAGLRLAGLPDVVTKPQDTRSASRAGARSNSRA